MEVCKWGPMYTECTATSTTTAPGTTIFRDHPPQIRINTLTDAQTNTCTIHLPAPTTAVANYKHHGCKHSPDALVHLAIVPSDTRDWSPAPSFAVDVCPCNFNKVADILMKIKAKELKSVAESIKRPGGKGCPLAIHDMKDHFNARYTITLTEGKENC